MTVPRLLAAALVCGAMACAVLLAQSPKPSTNKSPANNDATIHANVHLVLAPVTVTDAKGKFVDGLQADDFVLYDDGLPQRQLQVDSSDTVLAPVALVVAIQASWISQPALEKIHKIGGMLQPLISGEKGQIAVLSYDYEIHTLQDFTRDSNKVSGAFESVEGRTIKTGIMLDAVMEGVKMLQKTPESYRRMMLIIGESRDRGSKTKLDQAVEAAQRASVTMYPLTYSAQATAWTAKPQDDPSLPIDPDYSGAIVEALRLTTRNAADEFAKWTGGRHLSFTRLEGLQDAVQRLSAEVHSQYLLSFAPEETGNKGLHRLIVQVRGHKGAQVRARPGYWP
ncbi:MAG TPA: VWA domain-containing protein [Bryobacteraceae bacterium]|jgi:VWFA-related protein